MKFNIKSVISGYTNILVDYEYLRPTLQMFYYILTGDFPEDIGPTEHITLQIVLSDERNSELVDKILKEALTDNIQDNDLFDFLISFTKTFKLIFDKKGQEVLEIFKQDKQAALERMMLTIAAAKVALDTYLLLNENKLIEEMPELEIYPVENFDIIQAALEIEPNYYNILEEFERFKAEFDANELIRKNISQDQLRQDLDLKRQELEDLLNKEKDSPFSDFIGSLKSFDDEIGDADDDDEWM